MVHVHLATLPKTINEALGKAPRPHGSAAPNSNAPASDVIAPPSKAATTAPRFYQGKIEQFCRYTLSASARPRIGKKLFSQNNFRGFGAPMRYLVCEISRFEPFLRGAVVPETIHNEISPCPIQVSNFVQTAALNGQKLRAAILEDVDTRRPVVGRVSMSSADLILFRHYADEALRWAVQSKNEKEIQALVELARAWTQAAANSPPEYRTV